MGVCNELKPSILATIMSFTVLVNLVHETEAQTGASEYLDPHNAARGVVGAPALSWSAELAEYARGYAATQVSRCVPLTHSRGEYGENLFWGSAGKAWTPLDAVTAWTHEVADYDYGRNSCKAGQMCGHYTQVVWQSTTHVGCAHAVCSDGADYFICSYDPPGNWIGERPF
jgi:pathogenesis-related protein 1